MTKEESLQLKGIAIMMMLWLHLFGTNQTIIEGCEKYIYLWNGAPMIYAMRKFGRMCVVLYTFLGGYGMYKVYQRSNNIDSGITNGMNNGKRALKLLANYWIVFLIFIVITSFTHPGKYTADTESLLLNFFALKNNYNGTLWFLMPYIILILLSTPIMRAASSLNGKKLWAVIIAALAVKILLYNTTLPRNNIFNNILINCIHALGLFFMFFIGAIYARFNIMEKCVSKIKQKLSASFIVQRLHVNVSFVCTLLLILLFFGRIAQGASPLLDPIYILIMIPIYLSIDTSKWIRQTLTTLGSHSTNIWFLHEYIIILSGTSILFFRYPIAIFAALLSACLICSFIINGIKRTTGI